MGRVVYRDEGFEISEGSDSYGPYLAFQMPGVRPEWAIGAYETESSAHALHLTEVEAIADCLDTWLRERGRR